jgi:hypothetical protein
VREALQKSTSVFITFVANEKPGKIREIVFTKGPSPFSPFEERKSGLRAKLYNPWGGGGGGICPSFATINLE